MTWLSKDPQTRSLINGAMIAAPLVSGAVLAAVTHHPAAWIGLVAGVAAIVGARMIRREAVAEFDAVTERIDPTGENPLIVDGLLVEEARAAIIAMEKTRRGLLTRSQDAEAIAEVERGIIDSLYDPLILCDGGRRVTRANQAARNLFGERMAGRDLAASIRVPDVLEAVDSVLAGAASRTVEFALPVPVERTFEARIKAFPHPGGGGKGGARERSVILTLHDISAIRRSEQMRADFIANASHELRTPLSSLIGFLETLQGPAHDDADARDRFLSIMRDQAERMSRLVNDLLSLSRIELDEHMPPVGRVDVTGVVRSAIDALHLKAAARGMNLVTEIADGLPRAVGDADQIAQVIQNLVTNAIKYGREGTPVTISITLVDGMTVGVGGPVNDAGRREPVTLLAVAVGDQGDGIPRTHLPRLTERFYRVDAARSRAMGGTGLGLAIVKHIMNRHRGKLTIESAAGRGSTFTVYFPIADAGVGGEKGEKVA